MSLISRRTFLTRAATLVAAGVAVPSFLTETARQLELQRPFMPTAQAAGGRILIVLHLAGGADGLNMLVPYGNPVYYSPSVRPFLAIPHPSDTSGNPKVIPINPNVGFHPNMARLKARFDSGLMACVQGVGYPNPDRSHFRGTDIWESAVPDRLELSGWLARYLNVCGCQQPDHLEALAVGVPEVPGSFWSETTLVPALADLASFRYLSVGGLNSPQQTLEIATLRSALSQASGHPEEEFLRQSMNIALTDSDVLQAAAGSYSPVGNYPDTLLGQATKLTAQIIKADVGTRVFSWFQGGYDTHSNELGIFPILVNDFDQSLNAFLVDMEAIGRLDDVLILTFSEFGRRLAGNASFGTDHGVAAPMYLLGGRVNGGLHGTYPSLTDLTLGDLKMSVDFRSVYATVLRDWLNIDPAPIMGAPFPFLNLISASGASGPSADSGPAPALTVARNSGPDRLETTITARGTATLRSISIANVANGTVDIGSERGLIQGAIVSFTSNPRSVVIAVNRVTPGRPTTVQLQVTDSSGVWPTFAGGGAEPWPSSTSAPATDRVAPATPTSTATPTLPRW